MGALGLPGLGNSWWLERVVHNRLGHRERFRRDDSLNSPCSLCVPNCLATADSTGTHSLYTTYQDHEIMFHVSTMLPYTPNNQQQVCEGLGQAQDFWEVSEGVT